MVFWHVETDYFALAVFIAMFIKSHFINKEIDFENKAFSWVMVICGFSTVVDIISSTAMNNPTNWWFYQISMILYAITVPILGYLWVVYSLFIVFPKEKDSVLKRLLFISIPFAIYTVVCITNPITSWMFDLTKDMVYTRGPLFFSMGVGTNILYSVGGIVLVGIYWKRIVPRYNIALLTLFYFTTSSSLIVQISNPGWLIVHATYAVVFMLCDSTIEEQRKKKLTQDIEQKNKDLSDLLEQVKYQSEHDRLTGVYNRRTTFMKCRELLEENPNTLYKIMHIDIKRFRLFNAFYGDVQGDKLLCGFARILEEMAHAYETGVCGRIEGDVFCLMVPVIEKTAEQQREQLIEMLKTYRDDFLLEPAIGIYEISDKSLAIEAMFTRATIAARESKSHQLKYYCIFDNHLEEKLIQEQQIVNDMWDAVNKEQLQVYLQPKYDIITDQPIGAEALVRWSHAKHGMISPGEFIPVFERNGFIEELDRYMWEHVCMLLRSWIDEGKTIHPISVNISRISMYSNHTVPFLKKLVKMYGLDPALLELELTESAYMEEPKDMKRQLDELRAYGFKILMDDFGSGYSSLTTLREIPFDYLKLDMTFIENAQNSDRAKIILSSVMDMADKIQIPVISEGVETTDQKEFLKQIGCRYVQGYLYAKPMPVAEYEKMLWM